ncbi:MAG: serine/threonine-protein phosphatase [Candidatus Latescibacteria bacterium]|nr:serine/threonine-protein phosphatase [Candidatus Latescibacterota bacterium]
MFDMNVAGKTDVGLLRTNNEDNFAIDGSLLIVADGMGGAVAGEVASSIAVSTISELLGDVQFTTDDETARKIDQAIKAADEEIKARIRIKPVLEGMGTTVVVLKHFGDRVLIGNIGDSRAYLISNSAAGAARSAPPSTSAADANAQTAILMPVDLDAPKKTAGSIRRITEDHSVVMDLVKSGVITEDEIRTHPLRNRITKCVGSLRKDATDTTWLDVHDNDVIIMCSDGLWELVHEDIILAVVSSSHSMEEACSRLIDAANDAGGLDNITVIAAQFIQK